MPDLRLGTRGSTLALTQSRWVARELHRLTGAKVEVEAIRTAGDRHQDRPLPEIGGKGLFTAEIDRALLEGRVDVAVHSLKDLPTDAHHDLVLACIPEREDPRDVLVAAGGGKVSLTDLPEGARVGTGSLRRKALALAFRGDLDVMPIRGNLDTRLRKLEEGACDVLVLAAAGLRRLGREALVGEWLERTSWLPAPGQGALGIVSRLDDEETREQLLHLHDPPTAAAVRAERRLLVRLEGGCQVPIGAVGLPYGTGLRLWGLVASPDGRQVVREDRTGGVADPEALGDEVAEALLERGAGEILARISPGDVPGMTHP